MGCGTRDALPKPANVAISQKRADIGILTCLSSLITAIYRGLNPASLRGPIRGSQALCTGSPCNAFNHRVTLYLRRFWASQELLGAPLPDCPSYARIQTRLDIFIGTFDTFSNI